jgi:23S rRNA pseudouridine2457 synthase
MAKLILFNKPFGVLSQFSGDNPSLTLAGFISAKGVYPAGRLDKDSEGLLLLTDDGSVQHWVSHPDKKMPKTYYVQVEGVATAASLVLLENGIRLKDGLTKPAKASLIDEPQLWPRDPPVRYRKQIPTSWIKLTISEGRNRQVRRMTAAAGFPTLRLVRVQIGSWSLKNLQPGEFAELNVEAP